MIKITDLDQEYVFTDDESNTHVVLPDNLNWKMMLAAYMMENEIDKITLQSNSNMRLMFSGKYYPVMVCGLDGAVHIKFVTKKEFEKYCE